MSIMNENADSLNDKDFPILSSSDMLAANNLTSMHQDTFGDFPYNFLTNSAGKIMLVVTLPRDSGLHIMAIGAASLGSLGPLSLQNNPFLEQMVLEGDFPENFQIYCTPGKQIELLQLLDPATMADLVDYCRSYQFELYRDTLYVAQAEEASDENDETTLFEDTKNLLQKHEHFFKNF